MTVQQADELLRTLGSMNTELREIARLLQVIAIAVEHSLPPLRDRILGRRCAGGAAPDSSRNL